MGAARWSLMLGVGLGAGAVIASGRLVRPDPRGALFTQRGCTECHAVSGLGLKAATDVAPDLTYAYADVVIRYGVTLETFLDNPAGVMRLMLASHLRLTAAQRDSIVVILKQLYYERRADRDDPPSSGRRGGTALVPQTFP